MLCPLGVLQNVALSPLGSATAANAYAGLPAVADIAEGWLIGLPDAVARHIVMGFESPDRARALSDDEISAVVTEAEIKVEAVAALDVDDWNVDDEVSAINNHMLGTRADHRGERQIAAAVLVGDGSRDFVLRYSGTCQESNAEQYCERAENTARGHGASTQSDSEACTTADKCLSRDLFFERSGG